MCRVTPLPAEALHHAEQRAQLSELGGREAVINDWGVQADISGAACRKAVVGFIFFFGGFV